LAADTLRARRRSAVVPAAAIGLDLARWQASAAAMADACRAEKATVESPASRLGLLLGTCAMRGLDKLTLVGRRRIYDLGAWLEQLIAESTGKNGRAIIPVDREGLASPSAYGHDRVFAYRAPHLGARRRAGCGCRGTRRRGRPVVRLDVAEPYALAGEFFRWEIATAVAGAVMEINPLRSAGCRGQQDRDAQADLRLRGLLDTCRRNPPPFATAGWRCSPIAPIRNSSQRQQTHRRPRRGSARTSRAWAQATTSPCWPTSR
jgi:hypothetical protein